MHARASMLLAFLLCAACNLAPHEDESKSHVIAPAAAATTQLQAPPKLPSEPQSKPLSSEPPPKPPPLRAITRAFTFTGELTQGGWIRGKAPAGARSVMLDEAALELDSEGQFFAAFDRDATPSSQLVAILANGERITKPLQIAPRNWRIERVNVARRSGGPSAAFMKRRLPELNAINAARAKVTGARGWQQDFIWPVKGRISGRFGSQRIYKGVPGSYHSGLDIAPGNGVPFVAPADGVVVLARRGFSLEGGLIIVDHGNGLNSAFLHASKLAVQEGEVVRQGQYIGNIGSTGRATGPHLHWGLKWRQNRLDPLLFVDPMD